MSNAEERIAAIMERLQAANMEVARAESKETEVRANKETAAVIKEAVKDTATAIAIFKVHETSLEREIALKEIMKRAVAGSTVAAQQSCSAVSCSQQLAHLFR